MSDCESPAVAPLAILIPTYGRAGYLERLLGALAADPCVIARRLPVLVADNASSDHTAAMVSSFAGAHPELDLRLHVQERNLGMIPNMAWLIEHAPQAGYIWMLGDDDVPEPGVIADVLGEIEATHPVLIHLPSRWETPDGTRAASSPCPPARECHNSSRALLISNYCLHFVSSAVVDAEALRVALAAAPTDNIWGPHIWFGLAGLDGTCVVLPRVGVVGGLDCSWRPEQVKILTRDVIDSFAAGMRLAVSDSEFAQMLDLRYDTAQDNDKHWMVAPRQDLLDAVARFPASAELRRLLVTRGLRDGDDQAVAHARRAAQISGARERAAFELGQGEARFTEGELHRALEHFAYAVHLDPTEPEAWCNLGVVRFALDDPQAQAAFHRALQLAPGHVGALSNRAVCHATAGRFTQARADAACIWRLAPGQPAATMTAEAVEALAGLAAS